MRGLAGCLAFQSSNLPGTCLPPFALRAALYFSQSCLLWSVPSQNQQEGFPSFPYLGSGRFRRPPGDADRGLSLPRPGEGDRGFLAAAGALNGAVITAVDSGRDGLINGEAFVDLDRPLRRASCVSCLLRIFVLSLSHCIKALVVTTAGTVATSSFISTGIMFRSRV